MSDDLVQPQNIIEVIRNAHIEGYNRALNHIKNNVDEHWKNGHRTISVIWLFDQLNKLKLTDETFKRL